MLGQSARPFYTKLRVLGHTESPNTLPLFPSHVDSMKNGMKKGERTGWLPGTGAKKQKVTSV